MSGMPVEIKLFWGFGGPRDISYSLGMGVV